MLKKNYATILLAITLIISPLLLTTPANAGKKGRSPDFNRRVINRRVINRRVINRRVVNPTVVSPTVVNQQVVYPRVIRLSNGDVRLPHGEVVSSRRLVRLRTQGYWQLPNRNYYILPNQELVPARSVVRLQNGYVQFPNGVVVQI
ncbi:MAG: hypothetical protein KME23_15525 [Goleter apudmare HA4340-LM2]|jgi:hypothetical protein|nr:hypothetical protein [Goleter apudmare HA4340-LM2]